MHRPINREDLIKTIENLRPKLEAFQQRLDEINAEFNRNLDAVLHADQRSRHAEDMKRHHRPPGTGPLTDDNIAWMLREGSNRIVMWDVVIPFRLDQLTNQYGLDDSQRELVRALLVTRRGEFLELVDASPPPTIALSRLAQMVQRLKQPPPPAPPAPAHP